MSKSAIYLQNNANVSVIEGNMIPLGNTTRRFGKNLYQEGSGIVSEGEGYYQVIGSFTIVPTAVGVVGVTLFEDSEPVAISREYASTANEPINITIVGVIRNFCCNARGFIEFQLSNGTGTVALSSVSVTKM